MYFTYNSCVWILQIHVLQNSFLTGILSVSVMGEEETRGLQSVFRQKTPSRFRPYVVLEFAVGAKQPAIEWMISKLQASESSGGADLEVSAVVMTFKKVGNRSKTLDRLSG